MTRARYFEVAADTAGRPLAGVTVNVYQAGTTTPVTETIYAADTGAATLGNPLTANAQGEIEFFLAAPKRVSLAWSKNGYTAESHSVDVMAADAFVLATEKAAANGVATLDSGGLVPVAQLPGGAALDAEVAAAVDAHEADPAAHSGTYVAPDAIVDADGTGTHTTLAAAIAAVPSGGVIKVRSDLTVTPAAGSAAFVIDKPVTIDFDSGPVHARKIFNDGDGDVFATDIPIGAGGQSEGVRILNVRITRSVGGRSLGRAFNMHGAFHWEVDFCQVEGHAVGVYLDASPYPSGQGSHNTFRHLYISGCGIGVHNTGDANINSFFDLHTHNCDLHFWHESGLNPNVFGYRVENLTAAVATELIRVGNAQGLKIFGLHAEAGPSVGALKLESGATSVYVVGNIYNTGAGTQTTIDLGAVSYVLALTGSGVQIRSASVGQQVFRGSEGIAPVAEWYGRDTAGGAFILRAAVLGNGGIRIPVIAADPSSLQVEGDVITRSLTQGTVAKLRTASAWDRFAMQGELQAGHSLADISVNGTYTVFYAPRALTVKTIRLLNNGFTNYDASNFWTIRYEEWNGNSKVADIATVTQGAQIGIGALSTSTLTYVLAANRLIRVVFTKTGAPPALLVPHIVIQWDLA
jgi:hypothetical protein